MRKMHRALIALTLTVVFGVSSIPSTVFVGLGIGAVVVTQTACPGSKKNIETIAEAAKDIGGGTRDVIKAVGAAYDKGLINLAQKDKLADLLIAISRGGKRGVDVIATIQQSGLSDIPADKRQALSLIFSDEVLAPFLQLLTELGKLSDANSAAIRAALVGVRTAILLLSDKIGRADIRRKIQQREAVWAA